MTEIPERIQDILGIAEYDRDTVGKSDASVLLFDDKVLKICSVGEDSENEVGVMRWLEGKLPVPEVIHHEVFGGKSYLLMSKLSGVMSCDKTLLEEPEKLTELLASGLKMFWDVDISDCPYDSRLDKKLKAARRNVERGLVGDVGESGFESPMELLLWLENNRPGEDLVLSHGDFCLPNVFIKDGKISGFLDFGMTGIADRYQDIALCFRSLKSNLEGKYGGTACPGFDEGKLFEKLGIEPDYDKIKYYILLDELF